MKLFITKYIGIILLGCLVAVGVLLPQKTFAEVHGMSPRDGHVTTDTGAPIPYIKVTEYTDFCPPPEQWAQNAPGCPYPTSCHIERSVRTDETGYYYFPAWWPGPDAGTSTSCNSNIDWRYTCSNPSVFIKAVPDNVQAKSSSLIPQVYADDTCTPIQHPTSNIIESITTDLTCNPPPQKPPACGVSCFRDGECAGAKDGCTVCTGAIQPQSSGDTVTMHGTPGTCQRPPVSCGISCEKTTDCAKAVDGCTSCVDNDTGTGKSCKPVPACGVACTKDTQCAGAKDGCNTCTAGKCSSFSEDMCSCDGMDFTGPNGAETFFPGDNVTFVAYGKVPGKDWKGDAAGAVSHAQITSMSFALYQSKLTDPNTATLIAQSAAITPQVIENGASKVRYKVTWDKQIPATVPAGTLYRIQAKLKCSAKPGVLGATTTVGSTNYFSQLFDAVSGMFAKGSVLGESVRNNQQADTFFPGAKVQEKTCTFIKFFFN